MHPKARELCALDFLWGPLDRFAVLPAIATGCGRHAVPGTTLDMDFHWLPCGRHALPGVASDNKAHELLPTSKNSVNL
eukprot:1160714-Pelagomonas_calceolata.AAC.3